MQQFSASQPRRTPSRSRGLQSEPPGNLWLAQALWDLGGVQFGSFTMGRSTVDSPIHVNVRVLISAPRVLQKTARILDQEVRTELTRRDAPISPFDLVAGIPFGGLHLATAFSLRTGIPLIYVIPSSIEDVPTIEGRYKPGQRVLLMDDVVTTGGSILETGAILQMAGLQVRDVVVLLDRGQGAARRLRHHGYNLFSLLNLRVMLNYYMSTGLISEEWYRRSLEYIDRVQAAPV